MIYGEGGYGLGYGATSAAYDNPLIGRMASTLALGDNALGIAIARLFDRLVFSEDLSGTLTALGIAADTMEFDDAVRVGWAVTIADGLVLGDDVQATALQLAAMRDALLMVGAAGSHLTALGALGVGLVLNAVSRHGITAALGDTLEFADAAASQMTAVAAAIDSLELGASAGASVRLVAMCRDSLALPESAAGTLQMLGTLSDRLLVYVTLRVGGEDFSGWAWNATTRAPSEYTNFPFESFEVMGGRTFAAGPGGIFELTGDTDDGEAIAARLRTALMDFGNGFLKRVPGIYYAYLGNGDLVFKVITTSATGEKVEDWYRTDVRTANAMREGRTKFGRGLKSRYWQFEICNTDGADIEFADLQLLPLILDRRI